MRTCIRLEPARCTLFITTFRLASPAMVRCSLPVPSAVESYSCWLSGGSFPHILVNDWGLTAWSQCETAASFKNDKKDYIDKVVQRATGGVSACRP